MAIDTFMTVRSVERSGWFDRSVGWSAGRRAGAAAGPSQHADVRPEPDADGPLELEPPPPAVEPDTRPEGDGFTQQAGTLLPVASVEGLVRQVERLDRQFPMDYALKPYPVGHSGTEPGEEVSEGGPDLVEVPTTEVAVV